MRPEDLQSLSSFLAEFQKETDRGAALVGAAMIDDRLERLLKAHLIDSRDTSDLFNGGSAPIGTFSARIRLAFALGLITAAEFGECDLIRRVRNEFAHRLHGLSFSERKIHDLCQNLKASTPDAERFGGNARQLYINSVILTSLALWYRPEQCNEFRARERTFEYQLAP